MSSRPKRTRQYRVRCVRENLAMVLVRTRPGARAPWSKWRRGPTFEPDGSGELPKARALRWITKQEGLPTLDFDAQDAGRPA